MSARILDGKAVSEQVLSEVQKGIIEFRAACAVTPSLAFIRVGENPASVVYVGAKEKICTRLGIQSQTLILPSDASENHVLDLVKSLNQQETVHGILVQLPLPSQICEGRVFEAIDPQKDVDGFHPLNLGKLVVGNSSGFVPCTPAGIHQLLIRSGISIPGKRVVILGRSRIVGKPMALILSKKGAEADATVILCHSQTAHLAELTRQADILIAAMGCHGFVKEDMVREGVVIVDVGITRIPDASKKSGYRLVGDVDDKAILPKASWMTPVPGGVGPMTIAMLMANTLKAAQLQMLRQHKLSQ